MKKYKLILINAAKLLVINELNKKYDNDVLQPKNFELYSYYTDAGYTTVTITPIYSPIMYYSVEFDAATGDAIEVTAFSRVWKKSFV